MKDLFTHQCRKCMKVKYSRSPILVKLMIIKYVFNLAVKCMKLNEGKKEKERKSSRFSCSFPLHIFIIISSSCHVWRMQTRSSECGFPTDRKKKKKETLIWFQACWLRLFLSLFIRLCVSLFLSYFNNPVLSITSVLSSLGRRGNAAWVWDSDRRKKKTWRHMECLHLKIKIT